MKFFKYLIFIIITICSTSTFAAPLQSLANKLTFSSSACVHDITVVIPVFGTFTIPVSRWCELLALVKILLHLSTLMLAFRMLDSTVRAI